MTKLISFAFALTAVLLGLNCSSFSQSPYFVIANNDNASNSATVYNLNPKNGSLTPLATLETGTAAYQGGFYAAQTQTISPGAACIFVASGDPGDIAAFSRATNYAKVGNYTGSGLTAGDSMPMAENAAGTVLYAAYASSSKLAVWSINPDCSLTLANTYTTTPFLGSMTITRDQKTLLVTYEIVKKAESFAISGTTLTGSGAVSIIADADDIAATDDGQMVIMGTAFNRKHPSTVITANLPGFTNQQAWTLGTGYSAGSIALSPDAAAGNGCLYIGNTGSNGQSGITGVAFSENPLSLTYVNNVVSTLADSLGSVQTITDTSNGGGVYAAESAGYVGVYAGSSTCAVKLVKETQAPLPSFIFSLTSWVK
jgi:hypothetical protein